MLYTISFIKFKILITRILQILKEIAEVMVDGDEGTAAVFLDSADHWDWWRNMVKRLSMSDEGYYDIAVFMFCKLN